MLQYDELVKSNTVNPPKYDQQGRLLPGTGGLPEYKPLPTLNPQGQATYQQPQADPIGKFNLGLLELLQKAQGVDQVKLLNERNRLNVAQTQNSMAPASQLGIQGLAPGAALGARANQANLYNPEINNLTDRIQASVQAVGQYANAIRAAQEYSQEYDKYLKPSEAVIKSAKEMMKNGILPDKSVLDKLMKNGLLDENDWATYANYESDKKQKESKTADIQNLALEAGISDPFLTWNGTTYRINDGHGFSTEEEAFAAGVKPDFSNAPDVTQRLHAVEQQKVTRSSTTRKPSTEVDFTDTQLAKGAAAAGMSLSDFARLDLDTKNEYINGQYSKYESGRLDDSDYNKMLDEIDAALEEGTGVGELREEIDNSNIPQEDKEELKQYVETQAKANESWFSKLNPFD